jgi:hypothetical protein
MPTVDLGTGTTIAFATSAFTAELLSLRWVGIGRPALPVPHMATPPAGANAFGNRPFLKGKIVDPGSVELVVHFNADTNLPITHAPELVTILWPPDIPALSFPAYVGTGFVTQWGLVDSLDEAMIATMTLKWSGELSVADDLSNLPTEVLWQAPWDIDDFDAFVPIWQAPFEA